MDPRRACVLVVSLAATACGGAAAPAPPPKPKAAPPVTTPRSSLDLRAPDAFASIADRRERSRALFAEASRVLASPRCLNCHPNGDTPTQGDTSIVHDPPVARGPNDDGVPGLMCASCHQDANVPLARVPGAPGWHLAPKTMAWVGKSAAEICAQIKDPARNGHKTLANIVDHSAHDKLVAWGWSPGADRKPAPGTQAIFGALVAAWVETGAECPNDEEAR